MSSDLTHPARASPLDGILFTEIDARVAAVFRILLAVMVALAFESRGMHVSPRLADSPLVVASYADLWLTRWYGLLVLATCVWFAAGWRSRVAGFVLLVMLVPLMNLSRGQQSRQVLWLALAAYSFVRSDAGWSVRAWFGGATATGAGPIWPVRLIQIQLCAIYAVNTIVKIHPAYLSGDVLMAMSMMRSNFNVDMTDGIVEMGPLHLPVMLAAIGTVATEGFLAIAFWFRRLRWLAAVVGLGFHGFLMIVIDIWMLDWVTMFLYLAFLLPWCGSRRAVCFDTGELSRGRAATFREASVENHDIDVFLVTRSGVAWPTASSGAQRDMGVSRRAVFGSDPDLKNAEAYV